MGEVYEISTYDEGHKQGNAIEFVSHLIISNSSLLFNLQS